MLVNVDPSDGSSQPQESCLSFLRILELFLFKDLQNFQLIDRNGFCTPSPPTTNAGEVVSNGTQSNLTHPSYPIYITYQPYLPYQSNLTQVPTTMICSLSGGHYYSFTTRSIAGIKESQDVQDQRQFSKEIPLKISSIQFFSQGNLL